MTRFFTRLFGAHVPVAKPARRVSLRLESLETRATPSGGFTLGHTIYPTTGHAMSPIVSHIVRETEKRNILALLGMGRIY